MGLLMCFVWLFVLAGAVVWANIRLGGALTETFAGGVVAFVVFWGGAIWGCAQILNFFQWLEAKEEGRVTSTYFKWLKDRKADGRVTGGTQPAITSGREEHDIPESGESK
jgi:hypothetical protein